MVTSDEYAARAKRLAEIAATANRLAREAATLRAQMRTSVDADDPVTDVAKAADMHRSTVYDWISDEPPTRRKT